MVLTIFQKKRKEKRFCQGWNICTRNIVSSFVTIGRRNRNLFVCSNIEGNFRNAVVSLSLRKIRAVRSIHHTPQILQRWVEFIYRKRFSVATVTTMVTMATALFFLSPTLFSFFFLSYVGSFWNSSKLWQKILAREQAIESILFSCYEARSISFDSPDRKRERERETAENKIPLDLSHKNHAREKGLF